MGSARPNTGYCACAYGKESSDSREFRSKDQGFGHVVGKVLVGMRNSTVSPKFGLPGSLSSGPLVKGNQGSLGVLV